MKKKILVIALAVTMLLIAVAGATIAYLTDSDGKKNTMTVGRVSITQNEQQRPIVDGNYVNNQGLEDFVDGAMMLTPVEDRDMYSYDQYFVYDGVNYEVFNTEVVDKFISITNNGKLDVYVRTIIAFEAETFTNNAGTLAATETALVTRFAYGNPNTSPDPTYDLANPDPTLFNQEGIVWIADSDNGNKIGGFDYPLIVVDGIQYAVCVITYQNPLTAGDTTPCSLMQIYLKGDVQDEDAWWEAIGDNYDIIALSQAVQADGFDNPGSAFAAAFPLSVNSLIAWLTEAAE